MAGGSDQVIVTTNDGSKGFRGVVTDALKEEIERERPDLVMAVGPAIMMKFVAETTRPYGITTEASLNPIMVDGSGMCGGCRVSINGNVMFACTDGPDFDAHKVDWDLLMSRQETYKEQEEESFEQWKKRHAHLLADGE